MAHNIFVDSDIFLDTLLTRDPFVEKSNAIFLLAANGEVSIFFSSLMISNSFYVARKEIGKELTIKSMQQILEYCKILPVGDVEIRNAFRNGFTDFEDAIQFETANQNSRIEAIITRNKKDYKLSTLPVFTPQEFLALFK
ncbi:PIN domain-containing protein [Algoriphagus sp.]|uniref:type II toxin-antitoxin system VapC family toxin n=1 Tax=Algoriphagus sp. TaxID=1872435 RepID=UPI003270C662